MNEIPSVDKLGALIREFENRIFESTATECDRIFKRLGGKKTIVEATLRKPEGVKPKEVKPEEGIEPKAEKSSEVDRWLDEYIGTLDKYQKGEIPLTPPEQPGNEEPEPAKEVFAQTPTSESSKESAQRERTPEKILEEARVNYLNEYKAYYLSKKERIGLVWKSIQAIFGSKAKEEELPESLRSAKEQYNKAKLDYAKRMYEHEENQLEQELREKGVPADFLGSREEYRQDELDKYKFKLFDKFVVEEKLLLQRSQIESWPPKDKNIAIKALGLWMRQDKYTRLAISTGLLTLGVAATGGFAAVGGSGALLFAGERYVRGLASVGLGQLAGSGVERSFKTRMENIEKEKREVLAKLKEDFSPEGLKAASQKYDEISEREAALNRIKTLLKGGVMLATGMGTARLSQIGLGMLGHAYLGGGTTGLEGQAKVLTGRGGIRPEEITEERGLSAAPTEATSGAKVPAPMPEVKGLGYIRSEGVTEQLVSPRGGATGGAGIPEAPPVPSGAHLEELITVKQGEGFWQPVYRQLEDRLHQNPGQFGLKPEDLENADKVKEVLNHETGRLLAEQHFINPDGTELRIAKPGVKVILDSDNQVRIEGEGKFTYEWHKPEVREDLTIPRPEALYPFSERELGGPEPGISPKTSGAGGLTGEEHIPYPERRAYVPPEGTPQELERIDKEMIGKSDAARMFPEPIEGEYESPHIEEADAGMIGKPDTGGPVLEELVLREDDVGSPGLGEVTVHHPLDLPTKPSLEAVEAPHFIISPEKQEFLDNLIYQSPTPGFSDEAVYQLAGQIKSGKLAVEDFARYYAHKIIQGIEVDATPEFVDNLKKSFRILTEGSPPEKQKALTALKVILQRIKNAR